MHRGRGFSLTPSGSREILHLLRDENALESAAATKDDLFLAQRILKCRKLYSLQNKFTYLDARVILVASILCNRLFFRAVNAIESRRKRGLESNIALQLFFRMHLVYGGTLDVHDMRFN